MRDEGIAVRALSRRLTDMVDTQQHVTAAQMIQRDQVAQLQVRAGGAPGAVPALAGAPQRPARVPALAPRRRSRSAWPATRCARPRPYGLATGTPFSPGGGSYGFFPAPGTNYSVGNEPIIAARLDRLGKALHLHLIGISGYRTPQHSVEVGGFANDPHTRGEASDTPGVEGVPEATLSRFGLTRPFGGAAEADHIQLA